MEKWIKKMAHKYNEEVFILQVYADILYNAKYSQEKTQETILKFLEKNNRNLGEI